MDEYEAVMFCSRCKQPTANYEYINDGHFNRVVCECCILPVIPERKYPDILAELDRRIDETHQEITDEFNKMLWGQVHPKQVAKPSRLIRELYGNSRNYTECVGWAQVLT